MGGGAAPARGLAAVAAAWWIAGAARCPGAAGRVAAPLGARRTRWAASSAMRYSTAARGIAPEEA